MDANITITEDELKAIENSTFFITKHNVSNKIKHLLGEVQVELREVVCVQRDLFPEKTDCERGKIFQGENYRLLPYILLDYPKLFNVKSVFAYRTMFWWGKHLSCTLHLEGEALDKYRGTLSENIETLFNKDFYFCLNDTPWQYHYESDNYLPVEKVPEIKSEILNRSFIKLSRKLDVKALSSLVSFAKETLKCLLEVLKN